MAIDYEEVMMQLAESTIDPETRDLYVEAIGEMKEAKKNAPAALVNLGGTAAGMFGAKTATQAAFSGLGAAATSIGTDLIKGEDVDFKDAGSEGLQSAATVIASNPLFKALGKGLSLSKDAAGNMLVRIPGVEKLTNNLDDKLTIAKNRLKAYTDTDLDELSPTEQQAIAIKEIMNDGGMVREFALNPTSSKAELRESIARSSPFVRGKLERADQVATASLVNGIRKDFEEGVDLDGLGQDIGKAVNKIQKVASDDYANDLAEINQKVNGTLFDITPIKEAYENAKEYQKSKGLNVKGVFKNFGFNSKVDDFFSFDELRERRSLALQRVRDLRDNKQTGSTEYKALTGYAGNPGLIEVLEETIESNFSRIGGEVAEEFAGMNARYKRRQEFTKGSIMQGLLSLDGDRKYDLILDYVVPDKMGSTSNMKEVFNQMLKAADDMPSLKDDVIKAIESTQVGYVSRKLSTLLRDFNRPTEVDPKELQLIIKDLTNDYTKNVGKVLLDLNYSSVKGVNDKVVNELRSGKVANRLAVNLEKARLIATKPSTGAFSLMVPAAQNTAIRQAFKFKVDLYTQAVALMPAVLAKSSLDAKHSKRFRDIIGVELPEDRVGDKFTKEMQKFLTSFIEFAATDLELPEAREALDGSAFEYDLNRERPDEDAILKAMGL